MFKSQLIEAALHISIDAHSSQRRKNAAAAIYVTHPVAVALICAQAGVEDECALAAAIMHDVIEDTALSIERIECIMSVRFNCAESAIKTTLQMVSDLSEIKKDLSGNKLSWRVRKEEHLSRLNKSTDAVLAVKLADTYHNILSLLDDCNASGYETAVSIFNTDVSDLKWYWRETAKIASNKESQAIKKLEAWLCAAILEFEQIENQHANKINSLSRA